MKDGQKSLEEVEPELLKTTSAGDSDPQRGFSRVAVDAVCDSVSVDTTFKTRSPRGSFLRVLRAVKEHPSWSASILGSVVPYNDKFFDGVNSAVQRGRSVTSPGRRCRGSSRPT